MCWFGKLPVKLIFDVHLGNLNLLGGGICSLQFAQRTRCGQQDCICFEFCSRTWELVKQVEDDAMDVIARTKSRGSQVLPDALQDWSKIYRVSVKAAAAVNPTGIFMMCSFGQPKKE